MMRFDSHRARFFWEGAGSNGKYHLVNWLDVCKPKECGGLEIHQKYECGGNAEVAYSRDVTGNQKKR
jgi:hypothetical protein